MVPEEKSPGSPSARPAPPASRAVYMISAAAELSGVHPQTLRIYERKHLLYPDRTPGGTRMYSDRDIARIRMITELTQEFGLNLAGVERVMQMQDEIEELKGVLEHMEQRVAEIQQAMLDAVEETHRQYRRDLVPVRPRTPAVRRKR